MLQVRPRFLAGVFLVSAATLSLEICLIRYFSICQHYHFAFLVVSIAFMGYGASGSFLAARNYMDRKKTGKFLSLTSLLFSGSILLSFLLSNSIRFDFAKLAWDASQIWFVFIFYILLSLPFFFAGLTVSFAITTAAKSVHTLYFADLLGAGTGTILSLIIILPQGDKGSVLLISLLALFASLVFSRESSFLFKSAVVFLIMTELFLFISRPSWLEFRISPFKALPIALQYPQAEHVLTEWNAISRVDVIDSPAVRFAPGLSLLYRENIPPQMGLTIDGDGLAAVSGYNHDPAPFHRLLSHLPSSWVYSFLKKPKVLVVEPKGGLDIIAAHINESEFIKVIENNPLITTILRNDLAEFTGKLYFSDNLKIETAHSRTVFEREKGTYDLIVFPITDIFGSSSTGLYGFGENYLFTAESFARIFDCLSAQGVVSMSFYLLPPPRQEIRALATWIQVLEEKKRDPTQHIASLRSWGTISLFIKNNPFSQEEIEKLKEHARACLFDLVFYPNIKEEEVNVYNRFQQPIYYTQFLQSLSSETRNRHSRNYLFDINPVSDNRPFFFNFFKFARLKETFETFDRKWLPLLQGEYLILILLVQSAVIAFAFIFLPVFRLRARLSLQPKPLLRVLLYFGLIGMAFMFIEITLIQKFILFLGQPLYSVSIVIASLLISSGLGSLSSNKILKGDIRRNLKKILLLLFLLIALAFVFIPILFQTFIGAGFEVRLVLSVLIISTIGFFLGFPFPSGIRLLESYERGLIPWGWAANACFSVLGSIAALMIAIWGGYSLVLLLAGGCYILALPLSRFPEA